MTTYRFSNNASTTLGSGIAPSATTITVATSTGAEFPTLAAGQYFTATLIASGSSTGTPNEIVRVTARTGDTMTVVRGQEGTTAQSWSVGDTFANFITAGFLNQLVDSGSLQAQTGNYAVDSGTANAGVITLVPSPANLAALVGVPIRVKKVGATSTGAYALNVNSLGAKNVLIGGMALEGGELIGSQIYEVVYDGTQFNLISNPGTLHGDRISGNSVLNAALAQVGAYTLKGNLTGSTATPYDVPLSALEAILGAGNSLGVIEFGGGFVMQYGKAFGPYAEGFHAASFVRSFTVAVDAVIVTGIQNTNDFGHVQDMWPKWAQNQGNLSSFVFAAQGSGGGSTPNHLDGISWIAFGRG